MWKRIVEYLPVCILVVIRVFEQEWNGQQHSVLSLLEGTTGRYSFVVLPVELIEVWTLFLLVSVSERFDGGES